MQIFISTLQKIHTFVEMQQDDNRFKKLFRLAEMKGLFKDSQLGLQRSFEALKVFIVVFTHVEIQSLTIKRNKQRNQPII